MTVRWLAREQDADHLSLRAQFHFSRSMQLPLQVTVTVPPGLHLVSGETRFELTPPASPGTIEREYLFAVEATPTEPLILEASVQSENAGLTARDLFRFKRSEPPPPSRESPPAEGDPVELKGKQLGAPRKL